MTIINHDCYPFLEAFGLYDPNSALTWTGKAGHPDAIHYSNSYPNKLVAFRDGYTDADDEWLKPLDDSSNQYFYVEIYSESAFIIFPFIEWTGLWFEKIKNNEVQLFIQVNAHGTHEVIDSIYDNIIIKYGIDPQNITLASESADMAEHLEIMCGKLNLPKINLQWNVQFEHLQQMIIRDPNWFGHRTNVLQHKHYDKKFLSFNGVFRIHRGALVMLLGAKNLLEKGFVSYNIKDIGYFRSRKIDGHTVSDGEKACDQTFESFHYNEEILNLLRDNREELIKIDRIDLESQESDEYHPIQLTPNHCEFYENTYFSVVTETSFPHNRVNKYYAGVTDVGRILSEKIFKTISMRHPFIIVSNPYALKLLRDIGYKTFHPLINETYDKVKDPGVRMMMIINEIEKLCALEGEALTHFLTKAKEICDYNHSVMKNKKKFWYPLHFKESYDNC
jgi:hypothetical protein